jgi:endonuclease YncB( thermonuclease family)
MVTAAGGIVTFMAQQTSRYGRRVAEVFVGGQNVNLEMVRQGQAYAYREYLARCNTPAYH